MWLESGEVELCFEVVCDVFVLVGRWFLCVLGVVVYDCCGECGIGGEDDEFVCDCYGIVVW